MATQKQKSSIVPLGDRVLVRPMNKDEGKKTASGIIIPDTVGKERPEQGTVVAVGEGRMTDEGATLSMKVKVGDKVLFSKYGHDEIKVDGEEYFIMPESAILAIVK